MKTFNNKHTLLALAVASALSLTACGGSSSGDTRELTEHNTGSDSSGKVDASIADPTQSIQTIKALQDGLGGGAAAAEYAKIKADVASNAQSKIAGWIENDNKASAAKASKGVAGKMSYKSGDKDKTIVIDAKGLESSQLIKKGLIGAYQLQNAGKQAAIVGGKAKNQKTLETVTALLLGSYNDLEKDERDKRVDGNEFKKYMINYPALIGKVYDSLNEAKANVADDAKFQKALNSAINAGYEGIATRTVYYLEKGADQLAQKDMFGSASHNFSEGVGMVYSLQYSGKITAAEADTFVDGLDLYNTQDTITKAQAEAQKIKSKFGVKTTYNPS